MNKYIFGCGIIASSVCMLVGGSIFWDAITMPLTNRDDVEISFNLFLLGGLTFWIGVTGVTALMYVNRGREYNDHAEE